MYAALNMMNYLYIEENWEQFHTTEVLLNHDEASNLGAMTGLFSINVLTARRLLPLRGYEPEKANNGDCCRELFTSS